MKIKLMPESPDVDLEVMKKIVISEVEKGQGKNIFFEEELIAFGLKALIVSFAIDESVELDPLETALGKIESVSSVQVVDMRRAFG